MTWYVNRRTMYHVNILNGLNLDTNDLYLNNMQISICHYFSN